MKTQLNLDNLDILNVRAEDLAKEKRECFDVVSARAVAKLSILLELCVPFCEDGSYYGGFKRQEWSRRVDQCAKGN